MSDEPFPFLTFLTKVKRKRTFLALYCQDLKIFVYFCRQI